MTPPPSSAVYGKQVALSRDFVLEVEVVELYPNCQGSQQSKGPNFSRD